MGGKKDTKNLRPVNPMKSLTFHPVSTKILEMFKKNLEKRPLIHNISLNLQSDICGHLRNNQEIFILIDDPTSSTPHTPN